MTNTTRPRTEPVRTTDLAVGDVVYAHGMIVLLDTEPRRYTDRGMEVASFSGLCTNPDDVAGDRMLTSFLHEDVWNVDLGRWTRVRTNRWTVQGSEFAMVARVIPAAELAAEAEEARRADLG